MDKSTFGWTHGESWVEWELADIWKAAEGIPPTRCEIDPLLDWVKQYVSTFDDDDEHRIRSANLKFPPIVSADGRFVIDGGHRLVKLKRMGRSQADVIVLPHMPTPSKVHGAPFTIVGLPFEWKEK